MTLLLQLSALLLILLLAALARKFRQQRDALMEQQRRALDDEGLLAQLEVAEAAGSRLAARMLGAAKTPAAIPAPSVSRRVLSWTTPEFKRDFGACREPEERFDVIVRWHKKGVVFDEAMRATLLSNGQTREARERLRDMFDEQDRVTT